MALRSDFMETTAAFDVETLLAQLRTQEVHHLPNRYLASASERLEISQAMLPDREVMKARAEITAWKGYAATPLWSMRGLARKLHVAELLLKDESHRFGLGSFKALGGAYAAYRLIGDRLHFVDPYDGTLLEHLRAHGLAGSSPMPTLTCATDGNHGRAVAWAAAQVGCKCVIYLHDRVSDGREAALRNYGARVVRVAGTYDESVRTAHRAARESDWILVTDTSFDESDPSPTFVMAGYVLLMEEIRLQLAHALPPTHMFLQAGVGGLAAAVIAGAQRAWPGHMPRIVVVEPVAADCVFRSIQGGRVTASRGSQDTLMAGLACGHVSYVAWPTLRACVDDALTLPDEAVAPAMQLLSQGVDDDTPLMIGESGVAGLSALIAALSSQTLTRSLGLTPASRVLIFGTEGATDREIYGRLVQGAREAAVAGTIPIDRS
jgi:diaminopropionate ammonia-lyase